MEILESIDRQSWDDFLSRQQCRPFLQSFAMGEVYGDIGQKPVRLTANEGDEIIGICFAHVVPAKRGRHLSIPYGPIFSDRLNADEQSDVMRKLTPELKRLARTQKCSFIRLSPFIPAGMFDGTLKEIGAIASPLHLLAEHLWYLPLTVKDFWSEPTANPTAPRAEEEILMAMRKTTRNLVRRAEREGVTVELSSDPIADLPLFLKLHEETRRRHHFTPYTDAFFRAQVKHFSARGQCLLYKASYAGEVISTSIHISAFGETSYHHGASSAAHDKIPASYLLQWTAIRDALHRGDHIYNFWGIAPQVLSSNSHPFSGVTTFKTGFGGKIFELTHCRDVPIKPTYWLTRGFETLRKWKRGF